MGKSQFRYSTHVPKRSTVGYMAAKMQTFDNQSGRDVLLPDQSGQHVSACMASFLDLTLFNVIYYTICCVSVSCQESVKKQLLKRVQNVTTPKKKQGATPSRKRPRSLSFQSSQETSTDETDESTSSTLILERSPQSTCSTPEVEQLDGKYIN